MGYFGLPCIQVNGLFLLALAAGFRFHKAFGSNISSLERVFSCAKSLFGLANMRVSTGLTVNRQTVKKVTVNRQKWKILTVNRQLNQAKLAVKSQLKSLEYVLSRTIIALNDGVK